MKQNILLILICSLAFVACGGGGGNTPYSGSEYLNVKDIDIPGGNTTATLTIQASDNCEWTITWSDSWIRSITPSKDRGTKNVSVTVDINPSSTQSRTATIIVKNANGSITRSVTIKQLANSEQLSVSPTSINFTTEGGSQEVTVTGNTHWTITGKANWLKLSREEGDNNGSVTVTAEPNTTNSPRDAVLTFTGNNGLSQPLKVTQEAYETEFYVTTPANLTAGAPASSVSIGIAGNANWVVSSNKEWAMPDVTSGQGERTIEVKLTDNTDKEPRKAEITITATGNATSGSTPDKEGTHKTASYTVKVTADKAYSDMTPEEWAAVGIDYADVNYTDDFILDVRTADNYAKGHLVGSTNVSVAAGPIADGDAVAQALDKAYGDAAGKRVVIVCNSGQSLAKRAMDYFKTHGADMSKVTYLRGGNKGIAEGEYALNNGIVSAADINLSKDVVVDLRPADMYNSGHIVASKNIDVMTQFTDTEKAALDEQMAAVPEDGKLVLVCIKGIGLAKKATAYLQSAGADMKKVTYLIGGATALADSEYKSMLGVSEVAATDVIVDVRPDSQYVNGRIEGAIECTVSGAITDDQKTALSKVYEDNKDNNIVIVCIKGVGLAKSAMAYLQSIGADMTKVTYLIGGFDTWKAKYPVITQ